MSWGPIYLFNSFWNFSNEEYIENWCKLIWNVIPKLIFPHRIVCFVRKFNKYFWGILLCVNQEGNNYLDHPKCFVVLSFSFDIKLFFLRMRMYIDWYSLLFKNWITLNYINQDPILNIKYHSRINEKNDE